MGPSHRKFKSGTLCGRWFTGFCARTSTTDCAGDLVPASRLRLLYARPMHRSFFPLVSPWVSRPPPARDFCRVKLPLLVANMYSFFCCAAGLLTFLSLACTYTLPTGGKDGNGQPSIHGDLLPRLVPCPRQPRPSRRDFGPQGRPGRQRQL